jgi:Late exocytosis, associated with Golgi transport
MATLEALGFTVAGGSVVFVFSVSLFSVALVSRHPFIAPRCAARPPDVIYPGPAILSKSGARDQSIVDSKSHRWFHRTACFGWIPWVLSLSYEEFLAGVPGTGTRENGKSGRLLSCNLDSVVLLRYHALGLRIATVAAFIGLVFQLPIYYSASCFRVDYESGNVTGKFTSPYNETEACSRYYNLTNYERTTITNIPSLVIFKANSTKPGVETIWEGQFAAQVARLYGVVLCFWVVVAYTIYLLGIEWQELLALRRVYYLEMDVWGERRKELKQTMLYDYDYPNVQFSFGEEKKVGDNDRHLVHRDPWIPHPEQRETVPSVALYSVLVSGLPALPTDSNGLFTRRDSVDWQIAMVSTFFDHCVPNQPGFSSSVVAVTVVPSASDLARAWAKWYAAAGALRRLQFVRREIAARRHYEIQVAPGDNEDNDDPSADSRPTSSVSVDLPPSSRLLNSSWKEQPDTPQVYVDSTRNYQYYREVMGLLPWQDESDAAMLSDTHFGPEQTAVYSREFAQAAASCCPFGCNEGRIHRARIDELSEMEEEAAEELHSATLELRAIRRKVANADKEVASEKPIQKNEIDEEQAQGSLQPPPNDVASADGSATNGRDHESSPEINETSVDGDPEHNQRAVWQHSFNLTSLPPDMSLESRLYTLTKARSREGRQEGNLRVSSNDHISGTGDASDVEAGALPKEFPVGAEPAGNAPPKSSWQLAESIVAEARNCRVVSGSSRSSKEHSPPFRPMLSGKWQWPSFARLFGRYMNASSLDHATTWTHTQSQRPLLNLTRESTYAIVTFSSRQAAVAARHTLADGRAVGRCTFGRKIAWRILN